jgi:AmmeMemoRadiSam system protein A
MSPPPEKFVSAPEPARLSEFSRQERKLLLELAREAVLSALEERRLSYAPATPHLLEPRGAFTTLYVSGELRGCVGYVLPAESLYQTIIETARAAAFEDTRFRPITYRDFPAMEISLSVLSILRPISVEEIEVGRHGLVVNMSGQRGLLLPQVPVEHGWNRVQFLEQTCRKAGLPLDAWQQGATLEAFTAEVFADNDL